ncbi:MAG: M23 family metallopeptidase [Cyclobacteriaceae bacterium]|nr:M23 family metallopeptidase [Cyclobacteriaceae bacterium]
MLNKKNTILYILILLFYNTKGQTSLSDFTFPIKPGKPNGLAGTVGELRSSHFHTGLDIKTDGVEGLPVHASFDGYISRVSVSPTGYGLALYIKHPNGYTTVYGHLQRFNDKIAAYVLQEQYKNKTFSLNRYPTKSMFPVKKGEIIAFSGNSGSSAGPHLHWDLRDGNQKPLSSLKARFSEITDTTDPVIYKIAFKTLDINARINGQFGRFEFEVYKKGNVYFPKLPISLEGKVGLEVLGYDKLNGYRNLCGIYSIELHQNGTPIYKSAIDKLSFDNQRSIYTYYNYTAQVDQGERFHKLYIDDGNDLDFYKNSPGKGFIYAISNSDSLWAQFTDPYGNETELQIVTTTATSTKVKPVNLPYLEVTDNTLKIVTLKAQNETEVPAHVFYSGKNNNSLPYLEGALSSEYLIDLKKRLPDSVSFNGYVMRTNFKDMIPPNREYKYYGEYLDISFGSNDLFDTLYLQTEYIVDSTESDRELFSIGSIYTPLKNSIRVTLKPEKVYSGEKWSVYSTDEKGNLYYQGGSWNLGKVSFNTRFFGTYTLVQDVTPPEIQPLTLNSKKLEFNIQDELSGIDRYQLTINGKWILMHYDPKNNKIWSEFPAGTQTISGNLLLEVTDNEGNKQIFKYKL